MTTTFKISIGHQPIINTLDASSGTIFSDGYAVQSTSLTTIKLATNLTSQRFSGVSLESATPGNSCAFQSSGIIDPTIFNLGAGLATAVGVNSSGKLVRVTDGYCISAPNYIGFCDGYGTVTISPRLDNVLNAIDFGADPTMATYNDAVYATLLQISKRLGISRILWPTGQYKFQNQLPPIPPGTWIYGEGTSFDGSSAGGTQFFFYGPGTGILFNSADNVGQAGHEGGLVNLQLLGQLNTDHTAGMVNTPIVGKHGTNFGGVGTVLQGPLISVSGTPVDNSAGYFVASGGYQWIVSIVSGGTLGVATFKVSSDGGTTYSAPIITAATYLVTGTGITITFPSGTYITNESYRWCSVKNINECGVEIIGDDSVSLIRIRTCGFKYAISNDGAGLTVIENPRNDLNNGGNGYQDVSIDRGLDSTCSGRVGSFKFPFGGSANGVRIASPFCANSYYGWWQQDGVGNSYTNIASEVHGAWILVSGGLAVTIQGGAGEAQTKGAVYVFGPGGGNVFGLTIAALSAGNPSTVTVDSSMEVHGFAFFGNSCQTSGGGYPVVGTDRLFGEIFEHGNYISNTTLAGAVFDSPLSFNPGEGEVGRCINFGGPATAGLEVSILDYTVPLQKWRISPTKTYKEFGGPGGQYGGQSQDSSRLFSSGSGVTGEQDIVGRAFADIASGSGTVVVPVVTMPTLTNGASGIIEMSGTGRKLDKTLQMSFITRRAFYVDSSGNVTLVGTETASFAYDGTSGALTQPTISASGSVVSASVPNVAAETWWGITMTVTLVGT